MQEEELFFTVSVTINDPGYAFDVILCVYVFCGLFEYFKCFFKVTQYQYYTIVKSIILMNVIHLYYVYACSYHHSCILLLIIIIIIIYNICIVPYNTIL